MLLSNIDVFVKYRYTCGESKEIKFQLAHIFLKLGKKRVVADAR